MITCQFPRSIFLYTIFQPQSVKCCNSPPRFLIHWVPHRQLLLVPSYCYNTMAEEATMGWSTPIRTPTVIADPCTWSGTIAHHFYPYMLLEKWIKYRCSSWTAHILWCQHQGLYYMWPDLRKPDIMVHTKILSIKHYKNLVQKNAFHKIIKVNLQRP